MLEKKIAGTANNLLQAECNTVACEENFSMGTRLKYDSALSPVGEFGSWLKLKSKLLLLQILQKVTVV